EQRRCTPGRARRRRRPHHDGAGGAPERAVARTPDPAAGRGHRGRLQRRDGHRPRGRGPGVQCRARLHRRRGEAGGRGAQPPAAVHRADGDRPGRAAGGPGPGARTGHRGRLPAGRLLRPRRRRGVRGVRRPRGQGWLVLPHADGRDRAERRPQARHGAGAHRRRDRRADGAGLGPGQPGRARRRAGRRRRRPDGPGHPRLAGQQGLGQADDVRATGPSRAGCLRDRRRGHGRREPARRGPGGHGRVPGEAAAGLERL
ncbi:MAG: Enoyl-CoA hydratase, partial [uncultured Blastococcus sp.]